MQGGKDIANNFIGIIRCSLKMFTLSTSVFCRSFSTKSKKNIKSIRYTKVLNLFYLLLGDIIVY
jgi:hypothetical protein